MPCDGTLDEVRGIRVMLSFSNSEFIWSWVVILSWLGLIVGFIFLVEDICICTG